VGEICGYIYIQMAFTTLVIILPGWLARYVLLTRRPFINHAINRAASRTGFCSYELSYATESMREKESFITQVAVEARNPLNHALDHIKGTPNKPNLTSPNYLP